MIDLIISLSFFISCGGYLAFIVAFVASFNLGKYLINILTMSQDLGHTKVILSSRGITNHCIPARDGRSKKCLKTKLDPGYTTQKSFSQFTPGQGLKGSRGRNGA